MTKELGMKGKYALKLALWIVSALVVVGIAVANAVYSGVASPPQMADLQQLKLF
jgi:hypothetical protein